MLWLLAAPAFASGYYYIDSGARAIGRGGAFVVGADDLSAQYYNPAALSNIKRPMLNIQGWAAGQYVSFDRLDEPDNGLDFEPVENESPPIIEPSAGFATNLGGLHPALKNTYFALGMYVPTAPYLDYPDDGPQRYMLKDSLIWQMYAGPSVAQQIFPWLTVGAGLQYTFLRVEERLDSVLCLRTEDQKDDCDEVEEPAADADNFGANDLSLSVSNWDTFELSWNAGFIVKPTGWLEIGAAVQPPITYRAPGSLTASFDEDFALYGQFADAECKDTVDGQAVAECKSFADTDTTLVVTVPLIVRTGVQVTPVEPLRVELDWTYTQWSTMSEFRITDMNMNVAAAEDSTFLPEEGLNVTDDVVFKTGFQDAWSLRLGADYKIADWVQVRAGGHYETSALDAAHTGVHLPDTEKFGVGLGGTFTIAKRVALDVGFAHQVLTEQKIANSQQATQVLWTDPLDPSKSEVITGKTVGNGTFVSDVTYVSVGASVYFGAPEKRAN